MGQTVWFPLKLTDDGIGVGGSASISPEYKEGMFWVTVDDLESINKCYDIHGIEVARRYAVLIGREFRPDE